MRIPWRTQEYERTCDECGYVWRVPKEIARPRMRALPGEAIPQSPQLAAGQAEAVMAANAALGERAAAFRQCPRCESDRYKQRAIRS